MAANSTRRSSGPVLRSLSPSGRFYSSRTASFSSSSSAFASSTSTFSPRSAALLHRSTSPTRVNYRNPASSAASSVRLSLDRSISPSRSISMLNNQSRLVQKAGETSVSKKTCMCSPTNHPGSFRCSLHKSFGNNNHSSSRNQSHSTVPYNSNRLNMRRSAMTNSLVRIGTVEGELVKRALAALIRPSSHQLRRRENFQQRSSRLSRMSKP
ncbi:hypothetical protein M9H77_14803 [Catharanthus roseus]|uniref:Uncharacterized protein n=1 Tax=Catharanthus roseus TaxID=4058 RepID=A0ACC0BPD4_CATRO|nr:hypothetical protein M9H77_14803 [Catharanthus roseus]